jgi:hypothetical protein
MQKVKKGKDRASLKTMHDYDFRAKNAEEVRNQ